MILQSPHKMFWKTSITDPQDIGKYNIWSIHSYYPSLIHCYILDRLFSFVSSFLLIAFSSTAWAHLPFISQPVPHFRISNSKETTHSSSLGAFLIFCLFVPFFTKYQKVWTNFLCKSFQFSKYIDWQEEKKLSSETIFTISTPGWVPQTWTWPRKLF